MSLPRCSFSNVLVHTANATLLARTPGCRIVRAAKPLYPVSIMATSSVRPLTSLPSGAPAVAAGCESIDLKVVPPSRALRERIYSHATRLVCTLDKTRPLVRHEMESHARRLLIGMGLPRFTPVGRWSPWPLCFGTIRSWRSPTSGVCCSCHIAFATPPAARRRTTSWDFCARTAALVALPGCGPRPSGWVTR